MQNRKNNGILFFLTQFYPTIGGAEIFHERLFEKLIFRNFDVALITGKEKSEYKRQEIYKKIKIRRIPIFKKRYLGTIAFLVESFITLMTFGIKYERLQISQIADHTIIGIFFGIMFKKKVFVRIAGAGADGDVVRLEQRMATVKRILLKKFLLKYPTFISISKEITKELKSIGIRSEKIIQIPNGIDVDAAQKLCEEEITEIKLDKSEKYIVFCGRFVPNKGWGTLLEAISKINVKNDWKLLLVGVGPDEEKIKNMITSKNLDEKVIILNNVTNPLKIFKKSHIFVLPSRNEGFSISALEAMAAGLPIIMTKVSASEEIVDNYKNGILIDIDNVIQLREAIESLLTDEKLRKSMGIMSKKRVKERFDMELIVDKYLKAYYG